MHQRSASFSVASASGHSLVSSTPTVVNKTGGANRPTGPRSSLGGPAIPSPSPSSRLDVHSSITPLQNMSRLAKMDLVKTRNGSVLSRGSILKTDYYPTGRLDKHVASRSLCSTNSLNYLYSPSHYRESYGPGYQPDWCAQLSKSSPPIPERLRRRTTSNQRPQSRTVSARLLTPDALPSTQSHSQSCYVTIDSCS